MKQATEKTVVTNSPEETERAGHWFGERLEVGTVIDLRGDLGAGKTRFVQGLARGLGIRDPVRSPTFTICHDYPGRIPLHHIDAYRLEDPAELLWHGWDDMRDHGVVAVEWAGRIEEILPRERIRIDLQHEAETRRRLRFLGIGAREGGLVEKFDVLQ